MWLLDDISYSKDKIIWPFQENNNAVSLYVECNMKKVEKERRKNIVSLSTLLWYIA